MERETKKLIIEHRPPRDDQSHDLTRKFEYSQFNSANELTPAKDATRDWINLVDSSTWAKEICKSLPMADGHTYTLDHQVLPIAILAINLPHAVLNLKPTNPKKLWTSHPNPIVHQELSCVATEFPDLTANVSYNTQGALDELPLDVSNNMNQSGGNIRWWVLHPN
ncbi:hypothetical protein DSO57_1005696 [Entomophthora muscae]|uniref:Uncharacterized protein n=1 Tax=Entomophthora muscae TaxID=34485 RepID=A0ACC2TVH6_9FUNG|nr:hypothetical protein DSO57_1005696 [Entomophthora muscae]